MDKIRIALATGAEELNQAVIKSTTNNNYEYTQVHYREYFTDKEISQDFDICIISKLLPGEKDFDNLIFYLKSKNIRVIMILLDQDKEELETCIKYQISDVLTQPVKPIDILDTIENPKTFRDIEFIYKKLGLKFEIQGSKQEKAKKPSINIFSRKKAIKEKQELEISEDEQNKSKEKDNEKRTNNKEPASEQKEIEIQKEYRLIKAKKISFINLSQGAGSSFIVLNTAYALKDFGIKPSVAELPDSNINMYYQIGDESEDEYIPLAWKIERDEKDYENSIYKKDGINFYINKEQYIYNSWNIDKNIKFLNAVSGKADVTLFDVGNSIDSYVLKNSDIIFIVVDPIPHKLLNAMCRLQEIRLLAAEYSIKMLYVFNKWIDKLDKKDIEKYLQIKNSICTHYVNPEIYYTAAYKNQVVYQMKEGKNTLEEGLEKIINEIIPYGTKKRKRFLKLH
jgi:hypothetical protein